MDPYLGVGWYIYVPAVILFFTRVGVSGYFIICVIVCGFGGSFNVEIECRGYSVAMLTVVLSSSSINGKVQDLGRYFHHPNDVGLYILSLEVYIVWVS